MSKPDGNDQHRDNKAERIGWRRIDENCHSIQEGDDANAADSEMLETS